MSQTLEERAKKLIMSLIGVQPPPGVAISAAMIAQAIRQAENDKLEEARLVASRMIPADVPVNEFERGISNTAATISIEIERLKHKDT